MRYIFIFFFFTTLFFAQTKKIDGVIMDSFGKPLINANIIAEPLIKKEGIKFVVADDKGRFSLELEKDEKYEITASYLGYIAEILIVEPNSDVKNHSFVLQEKSEKLKEIIIKQQPPISIKKDTLTYNVNSFVNGNERKMKDVLAKLPGVVVDKDGGVTVQGKKVTQMLVEGKSFFGGGSKLAVENIPAGALDKIEVIDHFNTVGFLKKVSDSDELAMNVKLKKDKNKFVFGDVEAGAEVAGDNGFYLAHTALFYYTPKTNISFIGDMNSIGKRVFTYTDLRNFQGGTSSYVEGRKSLSNLSAFTTEDNDVVLNKSKFGALNFSRDLSSKVALTGFAILSNVVTKTHTLSEIEYLRNLASTIEQKDQNGRDEAVMAIANVKLDYSPTKTAKWFYNAQYQSSTNDFLQSINSVTQTNNSVFETLRKAMNTSVKQYLEWHKQHTSNFTTTLAINQGYDHSNPKNTWITNQPFLEGLIPFEKDTLYNVRQIKSITNTNLDFILKNYWVLNDTNLFFVNVGNNFENSSLKTSEKQFLTDGSVNDFAKAGFGNQVDYRINNAFVGVEYKNRLGRWKNKFAMNLHHYFVVTDQNEQEKKLSKVLLQPQWNSDLEFSNSESINFTYKITNKFPDINLLAEGYTLNSYNTVFKGNALLENERFHSVNMRYRKMNLFKGINYNASFDFVKKVATIRNEVVLNGINKFISPVLNFNPETSYRVNGAISKDVYRFNFRLNPSMNWLRYTQTLNKITTTNTRNGQNIGLWFKTNYKKWPDLSIGYTKGFGQFSGLSSTSFHSEKINFDCDIRLYDSWSYKFSFEKFNNETNTNQKNSYTLASTSFRYQKEKSPFGIELSINNVLNTQTKNDYSFSDYMISNRTTFIMPRVILFSVSYKL